MESKLAVRSLSALAQDTRLAIFRKLVEAGPSGLTVGLIGEALGVAPGTLTFHLRELASAGLTEVRQEGRFIRHFANFTAMNGLVAYLTENCCGGQPCAVGCPPVTHSPDQPEKVSS